MTADKTAAPAKRRVSSSLLLGAGVLLLQIVATGYFVADSVDDLMVGAARGSMFADIMELIVALALAGGIFVGARSTRQLALETRRNAHVLAVARGALADLLTTRFGEWGLTPSEAEIALFAIKGMSVTEIAALRGAAAGTVRSQLSQIYNKAGVTSKSMLVSLFIEELLPVPSADA